MRHTNAKLYTTKNLNWTDENITILGVEIGSDKQSILTSNYEDIVDRVRAIVNSWKERDLSLLGKVMVLNSLVSSLFVYKMNVLPSLPLDFYKRIYTIVQQFIWKDKKPKIKLEILQNQKQYGGVKLFDLRLKEVSLKTQWVKAYHENNMIKALADYFLLPNISEKNLGM